MESIFSYLIRLFMIGIVISLNVEANPINRWITEDQLLLQHEPFQTFEDNNEFSGKFLHLTGKFKRILIVLLILLEYINFKRFFPQISTLILFIFQTVNHPNSVIVMVENLGRINPENSVPQIQNVIHLMH